MMDEAVKALNDRVAELAPKAEAAELVKLADVVWKCLGAQGGVYEHDQTTTTVNTNTNDSTTTYKDGKDGDRRAGFAG